MGAISKSVILTSLLFDAFLLKATAIFTLPLNITHAPAFPERRDRRKISEKNLLSFPNSSFFVPVLLLSDPENAKNKSGRSRLAGGRKKVI